MLAKRCAKLGFPLFVSLCFLFGCERQQDTKNTTAMKKVEVEVEIPESNHSDSIAFTRLNYQIQGGDFEKAKVQAAHFSSPEARAIAFLRIASDERGDSLERSLCKKEALTEAIQNLNAISELEVKFALQQEFLYALLSLDPNHKEKTLNETFNAILDNFWETSTALDAKAMALSSDTIAQINATLGNAWAMNTSQLKKLGLEGKLLTATLRYPLNPEKAKTEIAFIKDQIWEIFPAERQVPFLLDLVEFEIETQNIPEAKRLVTTLKKTIEREK